MSAIALTLGVPAFAGTTAMVVDVIARSASDEAIHTCLVVCGLLRGACHWTRIRATRWLAMTGNYSGAALSPRVLESLEASDATTITTAISPITSVQMALISGFTPNRTSE